MAKEKVNRWYLTIEKEVPSNIFERPAIQKRVVELFADSKDIIDARIKEITEFLDMEPCHELSHEFIIALFKAYFYNQIANEAVHMAFMEQDNYDIQNNILKLLCKAQMQTAIYGKPMVDAFLRAIRIMPKPTVDEESLHDTKMYELMYTLPLGEKGKNYCDE